MKHINVTTRKHATLIPWEVQARFLGQVFYPAVVAYCHQGKWPYVDYTIGQWTWKASVDNRFGGKKSVTVQANQFNHIIEVMRTTIQGNDWLSHFGSFFFCYGGKGNQA